MGNFFSIPRYKKNKEQPLLRTTEKLQDNLDKIAVNYCNLQKQITDLNKIISENDKLYGQKFTRLASVSILKIFTEI